MADNTVQLDYFMDVILRQYCKAAEEVEILYDEIGSLEDALAVLFQENADLRFRLQEVGIEVPPSNFEPVDEL